MEGVEKGIRVIDPLPELREATKTKKLYYYFDRHLNTQGHKIVAKTIHNTLTKNSEGDETK